MLESYFQSSIRGSNHAFYNKLLGSKYIYTTPGSAMVTIVGHTLASKGFKMVATADCRLFLGIKNYLCIMICQHGVYLEDKIKMD